MSLRDEYIEKFGAVEGSQLYGLIQGHIDRAMDDQFNVDLYRVVRRERAAGEVFVAGLLDDLCRSFGMDPVEVWRRPRQEEFDEADRRSTWETFLNARLSLAVVDPSTPMISGLVP